MVPRFRASYDRNVKGRSQAIALALQGQDAEAKAVIDGMEEVRQETRRSLADLIDINSKLGNRTRR